MKDLIYFIVSSYPAIRSKQVAEDEKIDVVDALVQVYRSFLSNKIDDYNSSVYYENPSYLFECYKQNKML